MTEFFLLSGFKKSFLCKLSDAITDQSIFPVESRIIQTFSKNSWVTTAISPSHAILEHDIHLSLDNCPCTLSVSQTPEFSLFFKVIKCHESSNLCSFLNFDFCKGLNKRFHKGH